ncbi:hypothetical protein ACI5FR_20480 [Paenibacillus sp. HJGM_3]
MTTSQLRLPHSREIGMLRFPGAGGTEAVQLPRCVAAEEPGRVTACSLTA